MKRSRKIAGLVAAGLLLSCGVAYGGEDLLLAGGYDWNKPDGAVVVVDPQTGVLRKTVTFKHLPWTLLAGPDEIFVGHNKGPGPFGAVSSVASNMLSINWETALDGDTFPVFLAFSRSRDTIFVANEFPGRVSAIDATTGAILRRVELLSQAGGMAVDPTGSRLYVLKDLGRRLAAFSTNDLVLQDELPLPSVTALALAVDRQTGFIYLPNVAGNQLVVVDPATLTVASVIPTRPQPFWIIENSRSRSLYVTHSSPSGLSRIDLDTGVELAFRSIPLAGLLAVSDSTQEVFVTLPDDRAVLVFDSMTLDTKRQLEVPIQPVGVALSPISPLSIPTLSLIGALLFAVFLGAVCLYDVYHQRLGA